MPEGPSILILREQAAHFAGHVIERARGSAAIAMPLLKGQRIVALRSFGKQFLIELPNVAVRIHLMLFGSYAIDAPRRATPRLGLTLDNGTLDFYACSVKLLDGDLDELYDWRGDVLSDAWDAVLARRRLRERPNVLVCDALLDQDRFAGVGNIIKNEALFRARLHPLSTVGALPPAKLRAMVEQARAFAFEFLVWKRKGVLGRHLEVHGRTHCPRDGTPLRQAVLGRTRRRAFWCEHCQRRYG